MIIPQFSLRQILAVIAGLSLVFLVVSLAVRGQGWAIGVSVAFGSLVLVVILHALLFGLTWMLSVGREAMRSQPPPLAHPSRKAENPLASQGATSPFKGPA